MSSGSRVVEIAEEDEPPTTMGSLDALPQLPKLYRAARIDPMNEEDERPTASIPIPEALQRATTELPAAAPDVFVPQDDTKDMFSSDPAAVDEDGRRLAAEERTVAASDPSVRRILLDGRGEPRAVEPRVIEARVAVIDQAQPPPLSSPSLPPPSLPPPLPLADPEEARSSELQEAKPSSVGLAPKPGIVRRRAVSRRQSPARPRAAMQQVRALHAIVMPLCQELWPLPIERRSRRFWARWREIAGDRGVRREFVEQLLASAKDVRALVCELIAEVQVVDPKSVYTLVQRLEEGGLDERPSPSAARPGATPDRERGPLVGASVRVEGVSVDPDPEGT